jgi:hypothetical protein
MPSSVINSDDGVISGTSGIKTTGGDDGVLKIQTNGTDAASVTSGQVVSFVNNFGTVANLPAYQCRAWVNFNGTGTVAIRASGNVSSITDNGAGDYTVNFTTVMPDVNYAVMVTGGGLSTATNSGEYYLQVGNTTSSAVARIYQNSVLADIDSISVAIFR